MRRRNKNNGMDLGPVINTAPKFGNSTPKRLAANLPNNNQLSDPDSRQTAQQKTITMQVKYLQLTAKQHVNKISITGGIETL